MQTLDPALLWFLVGFALVLAEFAAPGIIVIFIGLGAWVVSLAVWLGWLPSLGAQIAVFAVSSLALLLGLRRFFKNWFMGFSEQNPDVQGNLDDFTGKTVTVVSALAPGGRGKVEFKGAQWQAACAEPLQPGDSAVIERVDGLCLIVRKKN
ncbi:MAG: NfeD family protein [Verrucomicrobiales bacterium]|nr:NfeD family protein [Verrucomicrobiales bacterium]